MILFIHNYYKQPGGEDAGVRQERDLLIEKGHKVVEYSRHSNEIHLNGIRSRVQLGLEALWSRQTHEELRELLRRERPEVAFVHNTCLLYTSDAADE